MSQEVSSSRKEKRAQRDAERRGKNKKRKHADTVDTDETANVTVDEPAETVSQGHEHQDSDPTETVSAVDTARVQDGDSKPKKKRKTTDSTAVTDTNATEETATKSRFIVFVGNLPYSTTDASLQAHFQKLLPFTLRHRTDAKTNKSRGFAFIEFENYDRMKTCLKLYHHTMFDPDATENGGDGKGNGKGGRRINVELTAGGGGKAENRKEKIKVKNGRLEEQRKRRLEAELKQKARKAKKERSAKEKESGASKQDKESLEQQTPAAPEDSTGGIHPSRLAMLRR